MAASSSEEKLETGSATAEVVMEEATSNDDISRRSNANTELANAQAFACCVPMTTKTDVAAHQPSLGGQESGEVDEYRLLGKVTLPVSPSPADKRAERLRAQMCHGPDACESTRLAAALRLMDFLCRTPLRLQEMKPVELVQVICATSKVILFLPEVHSVIFGLLYKDNVLASLNGVELAIVANALTRWPSYSSKPELLLEKMAPHILERCIPFGTTRTPPTASTCAKDDDQTNAHQRNLDRAEQTEAYYAGARERSARKRVNYNSHGQRPSLGGQNVLPHHGVQVVHAFAKIGLRHEEILGWYATQHVLPFLEDCEWRNVKQMLVSLVKVDAPCVDDDATTSRTTYNYSLVVQQDHNTEKPTEDSVKLSSPMTIRSIFDKWLFPKVNPAFCDLDVVGIGYAFLHVKLFSLASCLHFLREIGTRKMGSKSFAHQIQTMLLSLECFGSDRQETKLEVKNEEGSASPTSTSSGSSSTAAGTATGIIILREKKDSAVRYLSLRDLHMLDNLVKGTEAFLCPGEAETGLQESGPQFEVEKALLDGCAATGEIDSCGGKMMKSVTREAAVLGSPFFIDLQVELA
ncbi:unnamed protein product [Amoebophrya sp. A25]|nr:unnamed protein product [Amoebophrya sp. A25]|eukprot:GSA25T00024739001.1